MSSTIDVQDAVKTAGLKRGDEVTIVVATAVPGECDPGLRVRCKGHIGERVTIDNVRTCGCVLVKPKKGGAFNVPFYMLRKSGVPLFDDGAFLQIRNEC